MNLIDRSSFFILFLLFIFTPTAETAEIHPQRFVTPNGMVVVLVESHSLPLVTVQMTVKAGSRYDPEEKAGLANLTASLLERGTEGRTARAISEAIDFIGGSLSAACEEDYATVSLRVLKKDVETGFDLLSDILMKPTFQSQEVERKRKEILSEILSEKDEPGVIARKAFDEILFGHHPYHHPVNGLEKTLPSIGREDTLNFHREYYRPNNAIITMVGDLTEMEARRWVDKYFGPWAKGGIQTPKILPISSIKTKQVKVIDKEITQANIVLGHLGISRNDPDYHAISVMNYILGGGGFASRMMTRIRDNEGLAYGVYSRFDANLDPGSFSVVLQTKNASANQAITEVLEEIRRIQIKPVTDQELDESRSYLVGSFPLRLDTSSKLSNFLSMVEFNGLGLDYIEKYPKLIASVTKEEILRVAKTYLQPDRFILVVVANESEAKVESKHESKEIK